MKLFATTLKSRIFFLSRSWGSLINSEYYRPEPKPGRVIPINTYILASPRMILRDYIPNFFLAGLGASSIQFLSRCYLFRSLNSTLKYLKNICSYYSTFTIYHILKGAPAPNELTKNAFQNQLHFSAEKLLFPML